MQILHKVPQGKLLRITLEIQQEKISRVQIHGDFFLHPEECIKEIEDTLQGIPLIRQEIIRRIETTMQRHNATFIGASSDAIADAIISERLALKEVLPGVFRWSIFNEEKGYPFNSYALRSEDGVVLIDPVEIDMEKLASLGKVTHILLTNKDHERASWRLRAHFGAKVLAPALDAHMLAERPDGTFSDQDLLPGSLRAISVAENKSPGETAFLDASRKLLFIGDAAIGWPRGELSLLPVPKYADASKTLHALETLLGYDFETSFVGDGESIMTDAKESLRRLLARKECIHLKFPVI